MRRAHLRLTSALAGVGFLALPGVARTQQAFDGAWTLLVGKRTLLILALSSTGQAGQQCSGTLSRPSHMQTRDFASFSEVSGPIKSLPVGSCVAKDGALRFVVQDPSDAKERDTYVFHVQDTKHAEMAIDGVPLPSMRLVRAAADAKVSEDWDAARTYTPDDDAASNAEMKRMFDEDQKARQVGSIDWVKLGPMDTGRRAATAKLLRDGFLHTGEDYFWAATIFQHGSEPNDFLLAHTLSMISVRKGHELALWLACATLDRYLQGVKQPQIYGTQFLTPNGQPATQEPYNRDLISDDLRKRLDIPDIAAQEEQRKQYDSQRQPKAAK